jgi:hypothetical protein
MKWEEIAENQNATYDKTGNCRYIVTKFQKKRGNIRG